MEKEEKYTLMELVSGSDEKNSILIGALANAHLLSDYCMELNDKKMGCEVKAKLTRKEFLEILENFKQKEV